MDDVPLEKVLRRKVVDTIKSYGLYYESKPPTGMGASGLDLTVCLRGRFLAIEVKRSAKFDMTPRQAATAHAIQKAGGLVMLIRKDPDIARLRELIEAEHGSDEIVRRSIRTSIMEEFTRYLLDTFTEQARAQQAALVQAQLAQRNVQLQQQIGQLSSVQQSQLAHYRQQAHNTWVNLQTTQGPPLGGVGTTTITGTPAVATIPTQITATPAVTTTTLAQKLFRQWVDPDA